MAHGAAIDAGVFAGTRRAQFLARILSLRLLGWETTDVLSRIFVGALFLALAVRIGENAARTGRVTGLLLVASEGLVVILMIVRRPAGDVDRRWSARIVTTLSIVGPPLVRPLSTPAAGSIDTITAMISSAGLGLEVVSKLVLGRSFGLVPANRGIVCTGPYRYVRHPIYLGYLVTHGAFLLANPSLWNLAMLGAADVALMLRAVYEERTLERDRLYLVYEMRVRWRVLPGIF